MVSIEVREWGRAGLRRDSWSTSALRPTTSAPVLLVACASCMSRNLLTVSCEHQLPRLSQPVFNRGSKAGYADLSLVWYRKALDPFRSRACGDDLTYLGGRPLGTVWAGISLSDVDWRGFRGLPTPHRASILLESLLTLYI